MNRENHTANRKEKNTAEQFKVMVERSGMPISTIGQVTNIPTSTLCRWNNLQRNPPEYLLPMLQRAIDDYKRSVMCSEPNGNVIRDMTNEQLIDFLEEIRDNALKANGNIFLMCEDYRDINNFLKTKSLKKQPFPYSYCENKDKPFSERLKDLCQEYGYNLIDIIRITGIPKNTVWGWSSKGREPTAYLFRMVQRAVYEYTKDMEHAKTNGDVIRLMPDERLKELIEEIRDNALEANGNVFNMLKKYQDLSAFIEDTTLAKPSLFPTRKV